MFDGFQLIDCAITSRDNFIFSFAHAQEYASEECAVFSHAATKKLIIFISNGESWDIASQNIGGTEIFHTEFDPITSNGIFIDAEGQVYLAANGGIIDSPSLADTLRAGYAPVTAIKNFAGMLCGCGPGGLVFKRSVENGWERIDPPLPPGEIKTPLSPALKDMICLDIDGFAADDIYVAGGVGKLCHFNGSDWRDIPFPSNYRLSALCCGGDGFVYAGAQGGTIFKGRGDRWSLAHRGNLGLPFKDMVWFRDTLWCASDYGLWRLKDGELAPLRIAPEIDSCAGRLAVGGGQMLMGGLRGVTLFEEDYCYPLFSLNWQDTLDYSAIGT